MNTINYKTNGVCSRNIEIVIDDNNIIKSATFVGGCHGNTQGISKLVVGMDANDVVKRLKNIKCGFKSTSCPDQLATALEQYLSEKSE